MIEYNTPIKKNEQYVMTIDDIGTQGEGIGKIDGFTVFVENALPGEEVLVHILKLKKNYGYAKLLDIIKPSPARCLPDCPAAKQCGGCSLRHLKYSEQLNFKTNKVRQNLKRIGCFDSIEVLPAIGMDNPYHYRNKAQYPINSENGTINIGFYAARSHRIVNSDDCLIGRKENREIISVLRDFLIKYNISAYDEKSGNGLVRHLIIRQAYHTNRIMVCVVVNSEKFNYGQELVDSFLQLKNITCIAVNYNTKNTNVIMGERVDILWGKGYIEDYIGSLKFRISPHTFFQVNPVQTEVLYSKALEFAALKGSETVFDAYCGAGTISLFLAQKAKKVYGVEIVTDAIENAKKNAEINNITNAEFFVGKSEDKIPELFKKGIIADVMLVDPPRKGCDKKLLNAILNMKPKRIIYVSCDSATLARDMKFLCKDGEYKADKVQPIDLFPFTYHVETVCLLSKKRQ